MTLRSSLANKAMRVAGALVALLCLFSLCLLGCAGSSGTGDDHASRPGRNFVLSPQALVYERVREGAPTQALKYHVSAALLDVQKEQIDVTPAGPAASVVELSEDGASWKRALVFRGAEHVEADVWVRVTVSAFDSAGEASAWITHDVTKARAAEGLEREALGNLTVKAKRDPDAPPPGSGTDAGADAQSDSGPVTGAPAVTVGKTSLTLGAAATGLPGEALTYAVAGSRLNGPIVITAPAKVEVSLDGASFASALTLPAGSGTVTATTVHARLAAAAAGDVMGAIRHESPGASAQSVSVFGSIGAPTLALSPATLPLGATSAGVPGAASTYTVTAGYISGPVTVTAPARVEISSNGGTTFASSLTLTPTTGVLPSTTIHARIAATLGGAVTGTITHAAAGLAAQSLTVTGSVSAAAAVLVSTPSLGLGSTPPGTASSPLTYTVSGGNLTGAITITAPAKTEISLNGSTYSTSLTLAPTAGAVASTTVRVRIAASAAAGAVSGNLTNASPGAVSPSIAVTGTVAAGPVITTSVAAVSLGSTTETAAGTPALYTVSGANLTQAITLTAPPSVELSTNGTTYASTLTLTPTSGSVAATTVRARIASSTPPGLVDGTITHESTGAATVSVAVSGAVVGPPLIEISTSSLDLGVTTHGVAGQMESYEVGGSNLTTALVVTAPTGVELSTNGTSFTTTLSLAPTSGTVAPTTVYARLRASAAIGDVAADITHASAGATAETLAVSGSILGTPQITVSSASLALGTTPSNTPGAARTYTVSGTNLTMPIQITAPAGVEISDDGATFAESLTFFTDGAGGVPMTTVTVRIAESSTPGPVSGGITHSSDQAIERTIQVSGSVTP